MGGGGVVVVVVGFLVTGVVGGWFLVSITSLGPLLARDKKLVITGVLCLSGNFLK